MKKLASLRLVLLRPVQCRSIAIFFYVILFLAIPNARAQVSVGYYPWSSLLALSTNTTKPIWLDARLQTNTLFGSLSTELLPMRTFHQKERVLYYMGGGVRFNFIAVMANQSKNLIEGYSLNVGARMTPFVRERNIKIALEIAPFVTRKFDSGVLKTNFGLVYVLGQ